MKEKIRIAATCGAFMLIILAFSVIGFILPDRDISLSERRPLAQAPQISVESLINGKAMSGLEDYAADQFPLRESLRALKAWVQYNIYRQRDNNGIYIVDGSVAKLEYKLNKESVFRFIDRVDHISELYFDETNRIFYSIIPDKNYFLAAQNGFPAMDYDQMLSTLFAEMPGTYIDIFPTLTIEDYYRTDAHWRSERLESTAGAVAQAMGRDLSESYLVYTLPDSFYGVYYGQAALPVTADDIGYIINPSIESAVVTDEDKKTVGGVYYTGQKTNDDLYSYFLNGSSSLITIENPLRDGGAELVIFRDSFGSAFAPWLIEAYSRITLVDTRYILPEVLKDFVSFENADILFLYSTLIVNNSEALK